jgi:hypothetical protein
VFTIVDAIDHPPSSYTLSSGGSDFAHEYSFENQNLDIFKKPHPMSSTTNTTSSVDVDEEDVSLSFINIFAVQSATTWTFKSVKSANSLH